MGRASGGPAFQTLSLPSGETWQLRPAHGRATHAAKVKGGKAVQRSVAEPLAGVSTVLCSLEGGEGEASYRCAVPVGAHPLEPPGERPLADATHRVWGTVWLARMCSRRAGRRRLFRQGRLALDSPLKKGYGGTSRYDSEERRGERLGVLGKICSCRLPASMIRMNRESATCSPTAHLSISTPLWRNKP
jgi:hypothetical protein